MTEAENNGHISIDVSFTEDRQLDLGKQSSFNIGYLFPSMVYHQLKLDRICKSISEQHKISYSLSDVLKMLLKLPPSERKKRRKLLVKPMVDGYFD